MRLVAIGILGLLLCGLAWSQATSRISGTVRDPSGLAVPAAEVRGTQTATDTVGTINAGADGSYVLANLWR